MGTNLLLGLAPERIRDAPELLAQVRVRPHQVPPLWDGHAAGRIVDVLASWRGDAESASKAATSAQPRATSSSSAAI
jgi:hypothetical protein